MAVGDRHGVQLGHAAVLSDRSAASDEADTLRKLHWFAICAPGGEAVLARELRALPGPHHLAEAHGGVAFEGTLADGFACNLALRTATRVLARVGACRARAFAELERRAAALDWRPFVAADARVRLHVSQRASRLYHTGAVAERVATALRGALGPALRFADPNADTDTDAPTSAEANLWVRGERDHWTFSVDASGERLHRRGWRTESARASLRETLAALALELCEWQPDEALIDPMCGAGTIAIEAARHAAGRLPGDGRGFAMERWPCADANALANRRAHAIRAAAARAPDAPPRIAAFDRDPAHVERARRNAERAACAQIAFATSTIAALRRPDGFDAPGLVLVNPPYGKRLGKRSGLGDLYAALGTSLRSHFPGWRAGVLWSDPRLASRMGLRPVAEHRLRNGGLSVTLGRYAL